MTYIIIGLIFIVVLIFRGMGKANGWLYETMREFFNECLAGHRHQGSLSRILGLITSIGLIIGLIVLLEIIL